MLFHRDATPTSTKVVWNVVFGAIRIALVAPVPLLLTPFIISRVGMRGLGLWALFLAFNNLASLADLGFLGTLTKHVSEHAAKRDYEQLSHVINSGILLFAAAAIVAIAGLTLVSGSLVGVFLRQAPLSGIHIRYLFQLLVVAFGLNLFAFPFLSVITGLQQFGLSNLIATLRDVGMAILAGILLAFNFGITGLAYAILLSAGLNLALSVVIAKCLLPQFTLSMRKTRISDLRKLCAFSIKLYVVQVAVVIHNHIEKFLLAYFCGLTSTGLYDVANDLSLKLRGGPSLLLAPLLPAASELEAREEDAKTRQLYQRSQKYLAMVGMLIVLITSLLARRFVEVWLGPRFSQVAAALIALTVMQLINLTTGPGFYIFIGKGNLRPSIYLATTGMVLNVVLSTFLISRFGFSGAVVGTVVSLSAVSVSFVLVFHKQMKYPGSLVLEPYLKPLVVAGALALLARVAVPMNHLAWAGLIVTAMVLAIAYFGGLLACGYFDAFDLEVLGKVSAVPFLSFPARVIGKARSFYFCPPFHRIVDRPLSYLWWRTGLRGRGSKTVSLVTGERIVMRYPGNDWYTATEVFLKRDYAAPFQIPDDLRTIHDVGGNVGYATIFLAKSYPRAHVDVFEPHPAHLHQLDMNIALNALQSRTTIHPCAVGASCRELYLTDADTRSRLVGNHENGTIAVKVADWLEIAMRCKIDLLKMDIEGGEYEIIFDPRFEGLHIPYVCLEWHVHSGVVRPDVARKLKRMGYYVYPSQEKTLPDLRYGVVWARLL